MSLIEISQPAGIVFREDYREGFSRFVFDDGIRVFNYESPKELAIAVRTYVGDCSILVQDGYEKESLLGVRRSLTAGELEEFRDGIEMSLR